MSNTTTTGIRCGNCKHYHPTVAAVRVCHRGTAAKTMNFSAPSRPLATNAPLATTKQRTFIAKLDGEREVPVAGKTAQEAQAINTIECVLEGKAVTMHEASAAISYLLALPKPGTTVETVKVTLPKVPAGRYALVIGGITKFFKVDCPTEGTWAGRTFLKIQASDELHPVKNLATKKQVLDMIAEDPAGASKRYGIELGACGVCGRTLTDETSRANGIGPVCADKAGW